MIADLLDFLCLLAICAVAGVWLAIINAFN